MPDPIEFYFDFSSPYGYLAAERIDDAAAHQLGPQAVDFDASEEWIAPGGQPVDERRPRWCRPRYRPG